MSEAKQEPEAGTPTDVTKVLTLANTIVLAVTFLIAIIALFAVLALRSDVASLEEQVRKASKSAKVAQEEVEDLRKTHDASKARTPSAAMATPPKPVHIDAADTSGDCVIRPGDSKSLSNCIGAVTPGR